jgi:DNA-binding LytR/AlgR family response regulator
MKTLQALVVEDEGLSRRRLEKMVQRHQDLNLIPDSAKTGVEALKKIKTYDPDLIFMDIELKDFNAFEILLKLGEIPARIVFVTAFSDYAVKAFDVEAVDYLLKPFSYERFTKAVSKVAAREDNLDLDKIKSVLLDPRGNTRNTIIIPEGNTSHFIDGTSVEYIYSQGYYVNFVINNQKKLVRISLKALEGILPSNFLRINKSTIVNISH